MKEIPQAGSYEFWVSLGSIWFMAWAENPERENELFNESKSVIEIMSYVYKNLYKLGKIIPLEKLELALKAQIKAEVKRIDPFCDVKKGMKMAKTIYLFGYLSNIL